MCGRYVTPDQAAIERMWRIGRANSGPFPTRYNVAPTMQVPVLIAEEGGYGLHMARWGLIPTWWKKDTLPTLSFNARSEEAAQKPMWRDSIRSWRCLMPALGWYEWCENEKTKGPSGRPCNQPYFLHCPGQPVVAIAGIWSVWERPGAEPVLSCALLTREAAPSIAGIHHRMPVVLPDGLQDAWLDVQNDAGDIVAQARQDLAGYSVSTLVNGTKIDIPELIQRIGTL